MIIKSANFITSAADRSQYPETGLPEIAFAGRSNVGKSSMINILTNRRKLVKTSSTPGKTRLINFFDINRQLVLVDLPGYGYARVSKREKRNWGPMVETYISQRENLKGTIMLLDIRREPREDEFLMIQMLNHYSIPWKIALTKADKLGRNARNKQRFAIAASLGTGPENLILFSTTLKLGREQVLDAICSMAGISGATG
ncbi:MAG: YihA family ribosome biogenesis GTP-binding protein [Desulfococcus sp. 4484_241]|nr:MAG: YihA family ribosome biogenesis GTP-binding protein [Desulfococcus sp. 4484_241]RLC29079.1 MAG: YihA family ribosome biogenesis GTP-binding protein [Deltaproteobacteria bacterium]